MNRTSQIISVVNTILIVMLFFIADVTAQTYNYEKLAIMDPYSQPNIHLTEGRNKFDWYGSGDVNDDEKIDQEDADLIRSGTKNDRADVSGNGEINEEDAQIIQEYVNGTREFLPGHWDDLNLQPNRRDLKIDWLNKMLDIDKTDTINGILNYYDCEQFTRQIQINFTGIVNFDNYNKKDFYEEYGARNARFNIPISYLYTDDENDPYPHASCIVCVGPEDGTKKDKILEEGMNRGDWYKFEPQNDQKHEFGEGSLTENGPAHISGFYYNEEYNVHTGTTLMEFELENGVANLTEESLNSNLILENPNTLLLNYLSYPEVVDLEIGNSLSQANIPGWETDTEHYFERIKESHAYSDTTNVNPSFSNYEYDYKAKDSVSLELGRHLIKDTRGYTVQVRDNTAPVFEGIDLAGYLPSVTIGYWAGGNNVTPENSNIGWPSITDNSGLPIDLSWTYELIEDGERYQKYEIKFDAKDKSINENFSTAYQEVIVDKTVGNSDVSLISELNLFPNPASEKVRVSFSFVQPQKEVAIQLLTLTGKIKLQKQIQIPAGRQNFQTTLNLTGFSAGVYILKVSSGKTSLQKILVKQ